MMNENGKLHVFVDFCLEKLCDWWHTISTQASTNSLGTHLVVILPIRLITLQLVANDKYPSNMSILRGVDVYSDHKLVIATNKLKLKSTEKQKSCHRKHIHFAKLTCQKANRAFVVEWDNQFRALTDTIDDPSIDTKWDKIKRTYVNCYQHFWL